MIRLLVVDDSPTARALLISIFSSDPEIQIVGEAADGIQAVALTRKLTPSLVTMDVRMPGMDGFEATKEIMIVAPTPIVLVTASVAIDEVETSLHALRAGALAVFPKPRGFGAPGFDEAARRLIDDVKALAQVKVVRHWRSAPPPAAARHTHKARIVAIAASTGGPAALSELLTGLPGDFPLPILVVQHISLGFVGGLADWLNKMCRIHVKVAVHGEKLQPQNVYLAPDGCHLGVAAGGTVALSSDPPIGGFRPSGTHLFQSAAEYYGAATIALILTGMGEDGVAGLQVVRQMGGHILAQDERSSVIFGMPGAAVAAGLPDAVVPLAALSARLLELV